MVVEDLHDLVRLLEQHPEWRAELRRVLLGDELLQLPDLVREILEILRQHSEILAEHSRQIALLAAAQQRTEQRLEELAAAQQRTEQRLEELAAAQQRTEQTLAELIEAQRHMAQDLRRLVEWQRGEAGRRDGERYEQNTIRRAVAIFAGGQGGAADQPHVQAALYQWLADVYHNEVIDPARDPSLADIIWWKGDEVVVVEVSQKVDAQDVRRARQRAETLREAGVKATPVVIGEDWAATDTQALAQEEGVEWMIGQHGLSQGLLRFRRLTPQ
ncbi:MAG: hypothetical protein KatS3mg022_2849 [Armatimonadota bacterium]|nr:MAG: hypothetical protein KatS3mg022_2849 [Armatimonadota bacterium]